MIKPFIIFIILTACLQIASANPPISESYWGYATLNGVPAANGTSVTVEVYDTGEIIGNTTVQYENGGYSINVEFDDPNTPEDEGANEGNKLTWKVGGIVCSTPAQGTDIATSGTSNSDFVLVSEGIVQETDQGGDQSGIVGVLSTIIVPDDYPTIQQAVDNATNGNIIFVRSGTYSENLEINTNITLHGETIKLE